MFPSFRQLDSPPTRRCREPVGQRVGVQQPGQAAAPEDVVEGHEGEGGGAHGLGARGRPDLLLSAVVPSLDEADHRPGGVRPPAHHHQ